MAAPGRDAPAFADNRLWVPVEGSHCAIRSLNATTGATVSDTLVGGPELTGFPSGFSACQASDIITYGTKVGTSWSYIGSSLAPRQCNGNPVNASGSGIDVQDFATPADGFSFGGLTTTCDVPPLPPTLGPHHALSSDGIDVFDISQGRFVGLRPCPSPPPDVCSGGFTLPAGAGVAEVPTLASGDRTVLTTAAGGVVVIDWGVNGTVLWTGQVGSGASVAAAVTSTTVYAVASDGTLAAFPLDGCGAATCSPTWTATTAAAATDRPTVGGDLVYVGTADGTVAAFAAAGCGASTCDALWSADVGTAVSGSPVIDGGTLYVGSTDSTLTAFRLA